MRGKIAGSPLEDDGSGHVRVRGALRVLAHNGWVEVEQTVAEMRIRLGERARKTERLNAGTTIRPRNDRPRPRQVIFLGNGDWQRLDAGAPGVGEGR